jgi:glyoxylase-like metal-dependent hydrolase (beta-lactamase superfamily II)
MRTELAAQAFRTGVSSHVAEPAPATVYTRTEDSAKAAILPEDGGNMWLVALLVVVASLIASVGMVVVPFLALRRLPEGETINGMSLVKDKFVSAGVVPLRDHAVALADAGIDPKGKALLAELARRGFSPDDVKTILLTHGHSDHIGAIRKFPKAEILGLAAEAEVVEGRSSGGAAIMRFRTPRPTGIHLSRTLQDGEVLALGPYSVRVFAVPGHTPGCAAHAIGENLFLGDSANQGKDGRLKAAPRIFTASAEQNRKSLVELAHRLANDNTIKTLVFARSAPLSKGVAPLAEFASRA